MTVPPNIQTLLDRIEGAKELINTQVHPLVANDANANYQASYIINRLDDVRIALERLGVNDNRSMILADREDAIRPYERPRTQFSKKATKIMSEQRVISINMRHDYESLFIYGNLALDHWARTTGEILGVNIKHFADLYHKMNKPGQRPAALDNLFRLYNNQVTWLYYNLRAHRNGFIEHLSRPMQGGSTSPVHSQGFSLFTPSASGTVPQAIVEAYHSELLTIGSELLRHIPQNNWQRTRPGGTLQLVLRHIDQIQGYIDKERVGAIWQELGGETVSYETLTDRIISLISSSPSTFISDVTIP